MFCDMGATGKKIKPGDITEVRLSYSKMNDSVFWGTHDNGYPFSVFLPWRLIATGGSYEEELLHCNEGDSIAYIVPADSVFKNILELPLPYFLHKGDMMQVRVRIAGIMDSSEYATRTKAINEYRDNMDMQERVTLARYVSSNHISDSNKHGSIYVIPVQKSSGTKVKRGDMVSLCYKGTFLDGKAFDSVGLNTPLQFKYGDTAQMIEGLEIALKMMHEGEKTKIIIPSQLAFGNNGSSTGIVPPYTTVVYEVTLLKVKAL
jgi:FKBP-type peptidyl-prolyl cis-trans isomerase FkpA